MRRLVGRISGMPIGRLAAMLRRTENTLLDEQSSSRRTRVLFRRAMNLTRRRLARVKFQNKGRGWERMGDMSGIGMTSEHGEIVTEEGDRSMEEEDYGAAEVDLTYHDEGFLAAGIWRNG
jgi:hypothetical protein